MNRSTGVAHYALPKEMYTDRQKFQYDLNRTEFAWCGKQLKGHMLRVEEVGEGWPRICKRCQERKQRESEV